MMLCLVSVYDVIGWSRLILLLSCHDLNSIRSMAPVNHIQLWAGSPARFVRDLSAEEIKAMETSTFTTADLASKHAVEALKSPDQVISEDDERKMRDERADDYTSRIGYGH